MKKKGCSNSAVNKPRDDKLQLQRCPRTSEGFYLGYLAGLPKNAPIPDECFIQCPAELGCLCLRGGKKGERELNADKAPQQH